MGFIGSLVFTIGVTFKLLHLPGANELFVVGFIILLLVFIPLLILDRYRTEMSSMLTDRLKFIIGSISAIILGCSGLFKILHLQGANILLLIGAFVFAIGFLPLFFYSMYRKSIS